MAASASTRWFWTDWLGDQAVRSLTPAERGMWIDLIGLAAVGSPTGYVCDRKGSPISYEEIGRVANCSPTEAAELIAAIVEKGAASRDRTGRLFNRRMVRDANLAARRAMAGKEGGKKTQEEWKRLQTLASFSVPEQMPQQNRSASIPIKPITSSETASARARPPTTAVRVETQQTGKEDWKPPSAASCAEMEAKFAQRRVKA